MERQLDETLKSIENDFKYQITGNARNYVEVDIGQRAARLGYREVEKKFRRVLAVIPLKRPVDGMKVRIDGRTFVDYGQLDSGVAVPGYVVRKSGLRYKNYIPNDSMILNFT